MAKYKAKKADENVVDVSINKKIEKRINKEVKYRSETEEELRKFIIIFIVIVVLVVAFYFISKLIVSKRDDGNITSSNVTAGSINYSMVSAGTILNRPYDNYYVLVYDGEDEEAMYYSSLINVYESKEKGKIYYCDLGNELNKKYKSDKETGNKDATKVSEFSFGKVTLLKVSNGKIAKYIENIDDIAKELK